MNRFIEISRQGRNGFGYSLAVVVIVIVAHFAGSIPGAWALVQWKNNTGAIPEYLVTSLMLIAFVVGLVALCLLIKPIHFRHYKTLITPNENINFSRISLSALVWLGCTIIIEFLTYLIHPSYYKLSFNIGDWLPAFFIGILLIPLQSWFEEVLFRGYLFQNIGRWNIWAAIAITSIIFGLMHSFNEEVEAVGSLGIAMIYYIGFGLFASLLVVYDESLELPMGVHAANNIYAFLIVGYPSSSLPSASIFETTSLNFLLMIIQWVLVVILYLGAMYGLKLKDKFKKEIEI